MCKGFRLCAGAFALAVLLCGCKKERVAQGAAEGQLLLTPTELGSAEGQDAQSTARWAETDSVVCVLFGYGFNGAEFYDDAVARLGQQFGLEEEHGLVWPVRYPDDVKGRINNLYDMVNARTVSGIVLMGAPENTHYMLARLQDFWEGDMPYPVFSLFPQDDTLGMQATCDFVLDYERTLEDESDTTEMEQTIDKTAEDILISAVKYIAELPASLPHDGQLHAHVQQIVGGYQVRRYTDSETGIQAINHFVMEAPRN